MSAHVIAVGEGIGPIRFGMTAEDAARAGTSAWGEVPKEDRRLGVILTWERAKVFALAGGPSSKPHRIITVRTNNPQFGTREGLHVGSSLAEAKAAFGEPDPAESLHLPGTGGEAHYPSGLALEYDDAGNITCIEVNQSQ